MGNELRTRMREDVLEGRPVSSFDIVDAHAHMGRWQNFHIPSSSAEDMVRLMDRCGIRCILPSAHASIGPDFVLGNDTVLEAMREFPDRIYGYCGVNPNYSAQEMLDELNRCFDAGMVAIKMHPALHTYPADGERYRPAWDFANEHGLCVLSHTWAGTQWNPVPMFESLASQYPNAKILMGHSGFGYEGARQCCELTAKCPNVFLDIASSGHFLGLIERLVRGAGAERVLFGTDLPFLDCRPQIGRLAFSELDDGELALVLGKNATMLFGL